MCEHVVKKLQPQDLSGLLCSSASPRRLSSFPLTLKLQRRLHGETRREGSQTFSSESESWDLEKVCDTDSPSLLLSLLLFCEREEREREVVGFLKGKIFILLQQKKCLKQPCFISFLKKLY